MAEFETGAARSTEFTSIVDRAVNERAHAGEEVAEASAVGEFLDQFDRAEPGAFIAYHVGDLAIDRELGEAALAIRACQIVAMGLFCDREAHLLQRRFGPHRYVYYAVKR